MEVNKQNDEKNSVAKVWLVFEDQSERHQPRETAREWGRQFRTSHKIRVPIFWNDGGIHGRGGSCSRGSFPTTAALCCSFRSFGPETEYSVSHRSRHRRITARFRSWHPEGHTEPGCYF